MQQGYTGLVLLETHTWHPWLPPPSNSFIRSCLPYLSMHAPRQYTLTDRIVLPMLCASHMQLRELVPPQQRGGANGAAAAAANDAGGLEARRPKHVVLADTIQLLKHLQLKVGARDITCLVK